MIKLHENFCQIQNFTTGHFRKKYDNIDQLKLHVYASVQNIIQQKLTLPFPKNQNKLTSHLQDAIEAKEFAAISKEKVTKLVDRIISSKSQEVRETACTELEKLAKGTRIWEHQEIWYVFNFLITDKRSQDVRDGLSILKAMVQSAQQHLGKDNQISYRVRQLYFDKLKELIYFDQQELRHERLAAREILKSILNAHEFFILCYEAWKQGMKTIDEDKKYEEYIHVLVVPLEAGEIQDKESIEEEIIQLMEHTFYRARDIHNLMY